MGHNVKTYKIKNGVEYVLFEDMKRELFARRPGVKAEYDALGPCAQTLYTKPLKYLVDDGGRLTKKGDVDVELTLDVVESLAGVDVAVIMSGDSDYRVLGQYAEKHGVPTIFMGYKANMAWELRLGNHLFVEHIRAWIERGNENPDLSAGAALVKSIVAKAIEESSTPKAGVDKTKP